MSQVLCTACAGVHQRSTTKDHVLIRVDDALPFDLAVPPPNLPVPVPVPHLPGPPSVPSLSLTTRAPSLIVRAPPLTVRVPRSSTPSARPARSPPTRTALPPRPPRNSAFCDVHAGEVLVSFCETCGKGTCAACAATHRGHAVTKLSVARSTAEKHLRDATAGAQGIRERLDQTSKMAAAVESKSLQVRLRAPRHRVGPFESPPLPSLVVVLTLC